MATILSTDDIRNATEDIDHIMTTPVGAKFSRTEGPQTARFYNATRQSAGDKPLTFLAGETLMNAVKPGDTVILATGFVMPLFMEGETDGPIGTAGLARALNLGMEATTVVMTEKPYVNMVAGTLRAAGLRVYDLERVKKGIPMRAAVEQFPVAEEKAMKVARELIRELSPSAIIAIERPSKNEKGIYHSRRGWDISPVTAKVDFLIEAAKQQGIPTIGIGDGGNEIGMGNIIETVKKYVPTGTKCRCSCNSGVAAATKTDVLIPAFISNWGAYGIEASLAMFQENPDIMHDGETERRMLEQNILHGAVASPSGLAEPVVDQVPAKYHIYLVEMLNYLVRSRLHDSKAVLKYKSIMTSPSAAEESVRKVKKYIEMESGLFE